MRKLSLIVFFGSLVASGLWMGQKLHRKTEPVSLSHKLSFLKNLAIAPVFAQSAPTAINSLRDDTFLVIGYPSQAVWDDLHDEGNGPPLNGLLGLMDDVFDGIAQVVIANGVTTCSAIPSTGSLTGSITINGTATSATVTYGTPSKTAPTGWTNAGQTFEKKVSVTAGDHNLSVEFFCDKDVSYTAWSLPGDSISGSTRVLNFYIDREDTSDSKFEMAMKVTHASTCDSGNVCDVMLLRAQIGSSNHFQLWGSSFAWRDTKYQAQRTSIDGDYSSQQMSSYFNFVSNFASYSAVTGTDAGATTTADFDFSQQTTADRTIRGCVDYDSPSTALTASTDCSGYDLSAPPTNVFGAGDYTYTGLKSLHASIVAP